MVVNRAYMAAARPVGLLVRWSHPSGKSASTKGGSVTKPTAIVPREPRDRASRGRARGGGSRIGVQFENLNRPINLKNLFLSGPY